MLQRVDRAEIEEQIRTALRDWEDGRATLSEFEGEDIGVVAVSPPLSDADREVAVALNMALEVVSREGQRTREVGLGQAGSLILNELAYRGLPIVSKALWRAP